MRFRSAESPLSLCSCTLYHAEEHATVKQLVWKAEHSSTSNENYDTILTDAVNAFLEHAQEEETVQFPKLLERLGPEQNDVCPLRRHIMY